jgi:hypothetical protein
MNLNNLGLIETNDPDVLIARMRYQRNLLLASSDWAMTSDATTNKDAWATYRQALRDFPAIWVPADTVEFPDPPA